MSNTTNAEKIEKIKDIAVDIKDADQRIDILETQVKNLYNVIRHIISETGTGRLLEIYDIKAYDLTKDDLARGKFRLPKEKK